MFHSTTSVKQRRCSCSLPLTLLDISKMCGLGTNFFDSPDIQAMLMLQKRVADHDIDAPPDGTTTSSTQIDIYSGRGILIESQGPTWFYGTASEHSVLYQYQLLGPKNIWLGRKYIRVDRSLFQSVLREVALQDNASKARMKIFIVNSISNVSNTDSDFFQTCKPKPHISSLHLTPTLLSP
jgi:hypothetical protein